MTEQSARERFVKAMRRAGEWMREEQGGMILRGGYDILNEATDAFADAECSRRLELEAGEEELAQQNPNLELRLSPAFFRPHDHTYCRATLRKEIGLE